jgi:hypothetical protein
MSPTGSFVWAQQTTGPGAHSAQASGIATDCNGIVYITGTINGTGPIFFGPTGLNPSGNGNDLYIAALDPNTGNWLWANQTTSPDNALISPTAITQDCQGFIYVTGNLSAPFFGVTAADTQFATQTGIITLTVTGGVSNGDAFVAKAATLDGSWITAVQTNAGTGGTTGGTGPAFNSAQSSSINANCTGDLYITGTFLGEVLFGNTRLLIPNFNFGSFISKLTTNLDWEVTASTTLTNTGATASFSDGKSVTTDCSGNVYLSGEFSGPFFFGDQLLDGGPNNDVYIAKLTPNLDWVNVTQSVGTSGTASNALSAGGTSIVTNCQGDVYAVGTINGPNQFGGTLLDSITSPEGTTNDMWLSDIVSDRTVRLLGVSPVSVGTGGSVTPVFLGIPSGMIYSGLIPAFDYFVNSSGAIIPICKCAFCDDPDLRYIGTACESTELMIRL